MKPIFVCYVEFQDDERIKHIRNALEEKMGDDYYILVVTHENFQGIKFELFNSDLEEKDFENLKKKLL